MRKLKQRKETVEVTSPEKAADIETVVQEERKVEEEVFKKV
jgi:hypothetical protein